MLLYNIFVIILFMLYNSCYVTLNYTIMLHFATLLYNMLLIMISITLFYNEISIVITVTIILCLNFH